MPDSNDQDHQAVILDPVDDAVVADTSAPDVIGAPKLGGTTAPRLGCDSGYSSSNSPLGNAIQLCKFACGRWQELDRVHVRTRLQIELRLQLVPADTLPVGRIRQSRSHLV